MCIVKRKQNTALSNAIDRLADLFPYGQLLAATDPAQFLRTVADEVERLRKAAPVLSNGTPKEGT